jgi:hypothetical protein
VVGLLIGEAVSTKIKHIVTKDVVGLLLGEVVSTKKKHIVAKDVVGLQAGDSKNDSLTKMKTY